MVVAVLDQRPERVAGALKRGEVRADGRAEDHAVARYPHLHQRRHGDEDQRLGAFLDQADQRVGGEVVGQHVDLGRAREHDADHAAGEEADDDRLDREVGLARAREDEQHGGDGNQERAEEDQVRHEDRVVRQRDRHSDGSPQQGAEHQGHEPQAPRQRAGCHHGLVAARRVLAHDVYFSSGSTRIIRPRATIDRRCDKSSTVRIRRLSAHPGRRPSSRPGDLSGRRPEPLRWRAMGWRLAATCMRASCELR